MAEKKWFEATQKNSVNDTDKVLVYDGTASKTIEVSLLKGADNLTSEYVELTDENGELYRVYVTKEGEAKTIKASVFTATPPNVTDNIEPKYQSLIVNQIYGGGDSLSGTACSHSFIELYNLNSAELNLKGLYLWYKSGTSAWESMELVGIIPPYSSFLIRGAQHNSVFKDDCRLKINKYDQEILDINGNAKKLASNGMSVYISIGNETPETNPPRKLTNVEGVTTVQPAYVDLLGCGGTDEATHTVTAYETNYRFGMSKNCSCRRVDFYNGGTAKDISGYSNGLGDNVMDTEIIDYSTCEVEKYKPRSTEDGSWDMFVSAESYNWNSVNAFVLGIGEGFDTRTFTWQSKIMQEAYVKYRRVNDEDGSEINENFKLFKAQTSFVRHPDCSVSKHSAIIKNLSPGIYEYQVGCEGYWSDVERFTVKQYNVENGDEINILWMSDEQSWNDHEMNAFRNAVDKIFNEWECDNDGKPTYDFILETGDISQNGRRRNEYHGYFRALQGMNKKVPIMSCMGNNDLLEKKYGQCFANFFTNENKWANSVYRFRLGNTEFISLNSNTDYDYVKGQGSLGEYATTDEFLFEQSKWLDSHLQTIINSEDAPQFIVCYMHLSPFTCVRTKRVQVFTPIFEKHKIPLVLCGHQHMFTRSFPLRTGMPPATQSGDIQAYNTYFNFTTNATASYVDESKLPNFITGQLGINHDQDLKEGTHYVMINATGWKTSGKEKRIINFPTEAVDGYDYNTNNTTEGLPWWSKLSDDRSVPNYATIKITKESINIKTYQIEGSKIFVNINGTDYEKSPSLEEANVSRTLLDDFTLNLSERL